VTRGRECSLRIAHSVSIPIICGGSITAWRHIEIVGAGPQRVNLCLRHYFHRLPHLDALRTDAETAAAVYEYTP
jgi:hypothetical protein